MPQKYEVFHDATQITLSGSPSTTKEQQDGSIALSCTSKDDIEDLKSLISQSYSFKEISLFAPDVQQLWENFNASFKVIPAAGGVVKNEKGEILMIHRRGKWDLPKGKIDSGEKEAEAAIREVQEECGFDLLELGEQMTTTFHIYEHKGDWVLKPTYWFHMTASSTAQLTPQKEEDIDQVVWKSEAEVKSVLNETYPSLRALLLAEL